MIRIDGRTELSNELQERGFVHITGLPGPTLHEYGVGVGEVKLIGVSEDLKGFNRFRSWYYLRDHKKSDLAWISVVTHTGEVWLYCGKADSGLRNFLGENFPNEPPQKFLKWGLHWSEVNEIFTSHMLARKENPYEDFGGEYPPTPGLLKEEVEEVRAAIGETS